jgi:vacuolar-type H+-ATPase subunit C/Vma6
MDKFAYAIGRLRSLEKDLLDESRLVRMTEAADLQSAYQVLRELHHYAEKIDRLAHSYDGTRLDKSFVARISPR